ncbi:hypothetical protein GCM10010435_89400 [Winogradskya consettensis]|uniref:Uncharacterized protein n=1 Tax=Winogradskya consettensis TaxID=113560 RepID=A0A919VVY3_9ACTN|nr:hypothetical protein [Actinoplanes consettensis]GIM77125.1 hypothetical protein Aco04nite_53860 [Actinoplanes consettensis]
MTTAPDSSASTAPITSASRHGHACRRYLEIVEEARAAVRNALASDDERRDGQQDQYGSSGGRELAVTQRHPELVIEELLAEPQVEWAEVIVAE